MGEEEEVRKTAEDICTTLVLFLMMSGYQELGNKGGGGERGEFLVFTALIIDNGAITELSIARPSVCTAGWAGEGSALCPSSVDHTVMELQLQNHNLDAAYTFITFWCHY